MTRRCPLLGRRRVRFVAATLVAANIKNINNLVVQLFSGGFRQLKQPIQVASGS